MQIGILECGHLPDPIAQTRGTLPDMFKGLLSDHGFRFRDFDVEHLGFPDSISECDGWLLTGSKHGVYEDHPFIPPLEQFIRDAYAAHVPVVGICFGHQIMAQALGGRVQKYAGGWALGHTLYEFDGLGEIALNAWHQDQVIDPPRGARTIARAPHCQHAALAYPGAALSIQPHPEFDSDLIGTFIETRKGTGSFPDDLMNQAAERLEHPTDRSVIAQQIVTFFRDAWGRADV